MITYFIGGKLDNLLKENPRMGAFLSVLYIFCLMAILFLYLGSGDLYLLAFLSMEASGNIIMMLRNWLNKNNG